MYWLLLLIVTGFYCYEFFLRIFPGLVVPQLVAQYQTQALGIAEFASAYYIAYLLAQIPAGLLFDRFSVKKVLTGALALCICGSLIFMASSLMWQGIAGRVLIGIGSAFAFVGALYVTKRYLPARYFTTITSLVISLGTIAGAFGQVFASKMIHQFGWQQNMWGIALIGGGIIAAILLLPSRKLAGGATQTAQPLGLFFAQTWQLIKNRQIWENGVVGGLFYLPTSIFAAVWGITFLVGQYQLDKTQASFAITLIFLGWALGAPVVGWLCDKFGCERRLMMGGALVAALLISGVLYSNQLTLATIYGALFAFGLASSSQVIVWRIFHQQHFRQEVIGTASALTNMVIMMSGALSQFLVGALINLTHNYRDPGAASPFSVEDLKVALVVLPLCLLLSAVLSYRLTRRELPASPMITQAS
ncbi:MFS transporter [Dongshaea marina]|uniref:MFS transporter n=1 Tax=Dongshaea marina TaxID=2047966 RepID=UPI000D3E7B9C|nr:MFS transporter [Dongshaea marina]